MKLDPFSRFAKSGDRTGPNFVLGVDKLARRRYGDAVNLLTAQGSSV